MPLTGNNHYWLPAAWPAPSQIHAGITIRSPGHSRTPFAEFNLAHHVGDDATAVLRNRQLLQDYLGLPAAPHWLNQTHGDQVVILDSSLTSRNADAAYTRTPGMVCALLTADCLPILICNKAGSEVASIHAGWRGLAVNIIAKTLRHFASTGGDLIAWIGPHICADHYTVRADVRDACINSFSESVTAAFYPNADDTWRADLEKLARMLLTAAGVTDIHSSRLCTYANSGQFYSYRREKNTGRMATLIWIDQDRIG